MTPTAKQQRWRRRKRKAMSETTRLLKSVLIRTSSFARSINPVLVVEDVKIFGILLNKEGIGLPTELTELWPLNETTRLRGDLCRNAVANRFNMLVDKSSLRAPP